MGAAPSQAPAPQAVAPDATPQVSRAADSRLDGADRGLRAWMNAQALHKEAMEAPGRATMARDDPAAVVASHVLATCLDAVLPCLAERSRIG